jgi:hypothetical protein
VVFHIKKEPEVLGIITKTLLFAVAEEHMERPQPQILGIFYGANRCNSFYGGNRRKLQFKFNWGRKTVTVVETQIDRSFFAFTQYYLYYFDGH